jgi:AcrR family transcriptional regulator
MERSGTRREAILEAMIRVAGTKGYTAASVADVIAEAGASRTTFYKHFADKRDCFLAAYDLGAGRIVGAAAAGCARGRSWEERAGGGLTAVVELLGRDTALARAALVEIVVAGAEGRRHRQATVARLAELLEAGRRAPPADGRFETDRNASTADHPPGKTDRGAPSSVGLPTNVALMAVGAVAGLMFDCLQDADPTDLPDLLPELRFALLVPYLGPRAAAAAFAAA